MATLVAFNTSPKIQKKHTTYFRLAQSARNFLTVINGYFCTKILWEIDGRIGEDNCFSFFIFSPLFFSPYRQDVSP